MTNSAAREDGADLPKNNGSQESGADQVDREATAAGLTAFYRALPTGRRNNIMAQVLAKALADRPSPEMRKNEEALRAQWKTEGRDYGTGTFRGPDFHSKDKTERDDAIALLLTEHPEGNEKLMEIVSNTSSYGRTCRDEAAAVVLTRNPSHEDLRGIIHFCGDAMKQEAATRLKADNPNAQDLNSLLDTSFAQDAGSELMATMGDDRETLLGVLMAKGPNADIAAKKLLAAADVDFESLDWVMSYASRAVADEAWGRYLTMNPGTKELMDVATDRRGPHAEDAAKMALQAKPSARNLDYLAMTYGDSDIGKEAGRMRIDMSFTEESSSNWLGSLVRFVPSLQSEVWPRITALKPTNKQLVSLMTQYREIVGKEAATELVQRPDVTNEELTAVAKEIRSLTAEMTKRILASNPTIEELTEIMTAQDHDDPERERLAEKVLQMNPDGLTLSTVMIYCPFTPVSEKAARMAFTGELSNYNLKELFRWNHFAKTPFGEEICRKIMANNPSEDDIRFVASTAPVALPEGTVVPDKKKKKK